MNYLNKLIKIPLLSLAYVLSFICAKLFFGRVVVSNSHKIPSNGPLLFVANHRNMILDAGMVRYSCRRELYYLAKHTLFTNKIIGWFFRQANGVPIYRRQDDPSMVSKNKDSFEEIYKLFEGGKCLNVFPEGISIASSSLLKIKTGAARMAINTEMKNTFRLNLKIIPVGINYSNPSRFKSEVFIQYGDPICVSKYKRIIEDDFNIAVTELTKHIEQSLLELTTNLTFIDLEDTISYLKVIYKNDLLHRDTIAQSDLDDFKISKDMIDAVEWYLNSKPNVTESYISMISRYMRFLERLKLDDRLIISKKDNKPKLLPRKPLRALWFLIQFPIYLYGLINNFVPYNISIAEVYNKDIDEVEIAQYKFFIGLFVFSIFYVFQTFLVFYFSQSLNWTIIYIISLIPSGNFALNYHNTIITYLQEFRMFRIFVKRSDIINELREQRLKIIGFIQTAISDFEKNKESNGN